MADSSICAPKDASSGMVDVADGSIIEAMAKAVQSPAKNPPLDLAYPGPFRSFGWDRLIPCDLDVSYGSPLYHTYLQDFYNLHKNPAAASIADVAFKCLKKENSLRLSWLALKADVVYADVLLSNNIYKCMFQLVQNGGKSKAPFFIDAAECIAKEAKLMMKFMSLGFEVPYSQYALSQEVRRWVFKLVMFQGNWSADIAAVLLGIIKEADLMLLRMSFGYLHDIDTSSDVRTFALEFLGEKFSEIEESDEESGIDDDVLAKVDQSPWGPGNLETNNYKQPKIYMPLLQKTSNLSPEEEDLYSMAAVKYF